MDFSELFKIQVAHYSLVQSIKEHQKDKFVTYLKRLKLTLYVAYKLNKLEQKFKPAVPKVCHQNENTNANSHKELYSLVDGQIFNQKVSNSELIVVWCESFNQADLTGSYFCVCEINIYILFSTSSFRLYINCK